MARWPRLAPIAWVEDPFDLTAVAEYTELRTRVDVPVAAGDEAADPALLNALASERGLDVVRLDVPAIGGFTPSIAALHVADARGLRVSPHVYPEQSIHLAAAFEACDHIETFARGNRQADLDPIQRYIVWDTDATGSEYPVPEQAGIGFDIKWADLPQGGGGPSCVALGVD
jgi:L-alanine-DL-glutamate epimerase-like enolase superfamily enzyme